MVGSEKSTVYAARLDLFHVLKERAIRTFFQPIYSLKNGTVLGYEALSRGPVPSDFETAASLFSQAEIEGVSWELDQLCRLTAIDNFDKQHSKAMLFLNIDPNIIQDDRFHTDMLPKDYIGPVPISQVVLELTERAAICNFSHFVTLIEHFKTLGFQLAVDDAGAGYSGWNLICHIKPSFIKIDMGIVRDIHRDTFKQHMMRVTVDFARATGTTLIAEGIESETELLTLMELGVEFGQGFLLNKPSPVLAPMREELATWIRDSQRRRTHKRLEHVTLNRIGDCCESTTHYPPTMLVRDLVQVFDKAPALQGLAVVDDGEPVGLIMRDKLNAKLGKQYGFSLYQHRQISAIMDKGPLVVDFNEPVENVAQVSASRDIDRQYDDIIVTLNNHYFGSVKLITLLQRVTDLSVSYATYTNPLTGLPGNTMHPRDRLLGGAVPQKRWPSAAADGGRRTCNVSRLFHPVFPCGRLGEASLPLRPI